MLVRYCMIRLMFLPYCLKKYLFPPEYVKPKWFLGDTYLRCLVLKYKPTMKWW